MKHTTCIALMALLSLVLCPGGVLAQDDGEDDQEMVERTIKVPVKRYKVLDCDDVYQTANMNTQVEVRFKDALKQRVRVPRNQRNVRVGNRRYTIALALRTRCGLLLLVPAERRDVIEMLLGLPEDWPLTAETLREDLALRQGQNISVEGTVLGEAGGQKVVMVDNIYTNERQMPAAQREVQVFWPGGQEPGSITRPGSESFEYDCHHVEDARATFSVSVRQLTRNALLNELALRQARLRVRPGNPAEAFEYKNFGPDEVYNQVRRTDDPLLVEFTDTVQRPLRRVPEHLRVIPAVRYGRLVRLPVGAVFRTSQRLTCVVPNNMPTPLAQVADMLPGEKVFVRGQAIGQVGGEKVIRVDYLGFPDTEEVSPYNTVWLATLEWPSDPARTLEVWDFGRYRALDLPCLHRDGAREAAALVIRQYRPVTVEVPAEVEEEEEPEEEEDAEEEDIIEVQ
jgi:hypothetical protein